MKELSAGLNAVAAVTTTVAALSFFRAHGRVVIPVMLLLSVVAAPAIAGLVGTVVRRRWVRAAAIAVHVLGLKLLGVMFIAAWAVSPGSGVAATVPISIAAAINYLSINALQSQGAGHEDRG